MAVYKKDIYFTPKIATFQDSAGRIYMYIKDSVLNNQGIQNIHLEVIRKNHGETKRYIAILIRKRVLKSFNVQGSSAFPFRR